MTCKLLRSPAVREQFGEDGVILLDVLHDRMYSLDRTGSDMWREITSHGSAESLARYLRQSKVASLEVANTEAERFIAALIAKGLLMSEEQIVAFGDISQPAGFPAHGAAEGTPFLLLDAFLWLLRIEWMQFRKGFNGIYSLVASRPIAGTPSPGTIERVRRAFDRVCILYPRSLLCLPRSAAMAVLLRDRGVAAELVFGVRRHPFQAHAWLEVDGVVVNDKQGVKRHYEQLDRL